MVPGLNPFIVGSWGRREYVEGSGRAATAMEDSVSDHLPTSTKYFQISIISRAILNSVSCKSDLKINSTSPAPVDLIIYFKPNLEVSLSRIPPYW